MSAAIRVESLGKRYRLGQTHAGSVREALGRTFDRLLGRQHHAPAAAQPDGRTLESDGSFWALKDVSFEVQPGEVVGIIGRNGSGKSTLLKILSQITAPTHGRVEINGRVASLLEVGTGFHPELSGRENVYLNGAILGMTRAEVRRKFDDIVQFAELEQFIDTPVKRYSSGMYVRLAFAVAAHLEPEILLVDEVLAVGDASFQKKCLGKMGEVAKHGRTVLFVSHDMSAVRHLCSACAWLDAGSLAQAAGTECVIDAYLKKNVRANEGVLDLSNSSRRNRHDLKLQLESVSFNDGKDVYHGEPLTLRIVFRTLGRCEHVSFGVGFCTSDGTRIVTLDADVSGYSWDFETDGLGVVEATFPNWLLEPDEYVLDIAARSGPTSVLDVVGQFCRLTVLPGANTPSTIAMRANYRGGWRETGVWKCSPLTK